MAPAAPSPHVGERGVAMAAIGRDDRRTAAAWGAVAGVRAFTAPALLSVAWAKRRRPLERGAAERALTGRAAPWLLGALAAGELAADQWPRAPDRIAPAGLLVRVLSGAFVGSAIGRGRARRGDAAIAAACAAAAAFVSYWLRRAANRRLPNSVAGFLEDVLVLGAGASLAATQRRSAVRPWRR
jgi:uncharacterized membrane protein